MPGRPTSLSTVLSASASGAKKNESHAEPRPALENQRGKRNAPGVTRTPDLLIRSQTLVM